MNWKRWKLKRTDGTTSRQYLEKNILGLKNGSSICLKDKKYSFVLHENGAVGLLYGFDDWYGPFHEIIDHSGWVVEFK